MTYKKKLVYMANSILLAWFFLDMTGFVYNNHILVSKSWKEDGIFFIIFMLVLISFVIKEKYGQYILLSWLSIWFVAQFYFHWYFTLFGPWKGKIRYFADTIKLIPSTTIYIPDLYHIILHILILFAMICTIIYATDKKAKITD